MTLGSSTVLTVKNTGEERKGTQKTTLNRKTLVLGRRCLFFETTQTCVKSREKKKHANATCFLSGFKTRKKMFKQKLQIDSFTLA